MVIYHLYTKVIYYVEVVVFVLNEGLRNKNLELLISYHGYDVNNVELYLSYRQSDQILQDAYTALHNISENKH